MQIRRLQSGDDRLLEEAGFLFDHAVQPAAVERFLRSEGHHILVAYDGETPAGFVTGVEMTHPDKGTEMFLYELAVDPEFQRRGYGTALVTALADLARERGCYGMWVLTDEGNISALATYAAGGAMRESTPVMLSWQFACDADGTGSNMPIEEGNEWRER